MKTRKSLLLDVRGVAAMTLALSLPVVMGGFGLGGEVGYWYFTQRKVQNAADGGAYAAGVELRAGNAPGIMETSALAVAQSTGYVDTRGVLTLTYPPDDGAFAGDMDAVELELRENLPRLFTALFSGGTVPVDGRAVAQLSAGQPTCVLALDPTASGAVTFIGSTSTVLIGCNVHSNSLAGESAIVTGAATVQAPCMSASGGASVSNGLTLTECVVPYERAEQIPDPYATLPAPTLSGSCTNINLGGGAGTVHNIGPGHYCGMDMRRTVNMDPGVYIVDGGDLQINSTAVATGAGVTFYLVNGATAHFNGSASIDISAPNAGTYSGVLMFVDRNEPYASHILNGNSASRMNGAIYAANAHIQVNGGTDVSAGCTQVVARTIAFSGNSGVGIDCTGVGVTEFRSSRLVRIVE